MPTSSPVEARLSDMERSLLQEAADIAVQCAQAGNHPFGALLVDRDGTVLLRAGNNWQSDRGIGHAELCLAREAAQRYTPEFLRHCTIFTSVEPCCMCAGGIYWAGIGRVVFGMSEERLASVAGDNPENLTLALPCRQVFAAGRREISVVGPISDMEDDIAQAHQGFW